MEADSPLDLTDLVVRVEPDDTWPCRHVDEGGAPAAPTRLRLSETLDWPNRVENFRRWLNCPECGTRWRVWVQLREAKPSVNFGGAPAAQRLRLSPVRDVDRVIALVQAGFPSLRVHQFENAWPADDDGVWLFSSGLAGVQIESWNGCCPFLVDGTQQRTGETIDEVVRYVLEELASRGPGGRTGAAG